MPPGGSATADFSGCSDLLMDGVVKIPLSEQMAERGGEAKNKSLVGLFFETNVFETFERDLGRSRAFELSVVLVVFGSLD